MGEEIQCALLHYREPILMIIIIFKIIQCRMCRSYSKVEINIESDKPDIHNKLRKACPFFRRETVSGSMGDSWLSG